MPQRFGQAATQPFARILVRRVCWPGLLLGCRRLAEDPRTEGAIAEDFAAEVVGDKGYHSNQTMAASQLGRSAPA